MTRRCETHDEPIYGDATGCVYCNKLKTGIFDHDPRLTSCYKLHSQRSYKMRHNEEQNKETV
jgi:hypothetical protein